MSQEQPSQGSETTSAGHQAKDAQKPQRVWPSVIGVIMIIFGAGGVLSTCIGGVFYASLPGILTMLRKAVEKSPGQGMEPTIAQFEVMAQWRIPIIAISALLFIIALILLWGGIKVLKRQRSGVALSVTWAISKIVVTVPGVWINHRMTVEMFQAMGEASETSAGPQMAGLFGMMEGLGAIGTGFSVLWGWSLPVFVLIWFARRKVRDEVRGWSCGT
jgi:hypothetical protein